MKLQPIAAHTLSLLAGVYSAENQKTGELAAARQSETLQESGKTAATSAPVKTEGVRRLGEKESIKCEVIRTH